MQLKSSTTHLSKDEEIRVEYIHQDLFYVSFKLKNETAETKLQFRLTKVQLQRLHAIIGIMLPENHETRSL